LASAASEFMAASATAELLGFLAPVIGVAAAEVLAPAIVVAGIAMLLYVGGNLLGDAIFEQIVQPFLNLLEELEMGTWLHHILDNIHLAQLLPLDPLVLDLNGDGVGLTSLADGARFDFSGDLFKEKTGWVGAHDGILVVDHNGNGLIDDGSEMFGNFEAFGAPGGTQSYSAVPGFAQLAAYDSNGDGKVDASDTHFADIKVWQDANQNGKTDAGELKSLAEVGIASISTTSAPRISVLHRRRKFESVASRNSLTWQCAA
jgi:hypothetical protein